jgi:hypothetical protein
MARSTTTYVTMMAVLLGCLLALGASSADALYSGKDGVILATDTTFNALVLQSNRPSIVEFFAPWCTCIRLRLPPPSIFNLRREDANLPLDTTTHVKAGTARTWLPSTRRRRPLPRAWSTSWRSTATRPPTGPCAVVTTSRVPLHPVVCGGECAQVMCSMPAVRVSVG